MRSPDSLKRFWVTFGVRKAAELNGGTWQRDRILRRTTKNHLIRFTEKLKDYKLDASVYLQLHENRWSFWQQWNPLSVFVQQKSVF